MNTQNSSIESAGTRFPRLFLAHGAPDLVTADIPARKFLTDAGQRIQKPAGIVVISAHWCSGELQITGSSNHETIHDFNGFPNHLYQLFYKAHGAEWLNNKLVDTLDAAGYTASPGSRKGLDHGAWVPLSLMFPEADVPIVQLSLLKTASPKFHFEVGQSLEKLRSEGILVIGSGGLVHNLGSLKSEGLPPDHWANSFDSWLYEKIFDRDLESLFNYEKTSEFGSYAHPTSEHLMPLFVSMGAGNSDWRPHRIHHSFSYGNLSMASYSFGAPQNIFSNETPSAFEQHAA
ncbi:MAG: class III extradiol ring-cleavage dioxygenase [Pseudomonadota bacterium]